MKFRQTLMIPALLAVAAMSFAQTSASRPVPLQMDPPSGILTAMPLGALPDNQLLHLSVSLPYGDPVGVQNFVDAVSDPKSPIYRQYLTPAQVGQRFGLSAAAVQKVASYLTSAGMTIRLISDNRLTIMADATAAQAEAAFSTSIEGFTTLATSDGAGQALFAFTSTPSVPAEISPYVTYVSGLENFTHPKPLGNFAVTPTQLRSFYNVAPMYSGGSQGKGRTIAISNFDGFRLANVAPFYSQFSLPTPSGGVGSNITEEIPSGDVSGSAATAQGEGDLDIQASIAMAPLANIIIYSSAARGDLIGILTLEANDNKADICTESYGWSGSSSLYSAAHSIHLSMSAQGMTYMAASGDSGTSCLISSSQAYAPYPDEDPEVLVVGGTSTPTASNQGALSGQTGWSGSGGGWNISTDAFNTLPSWQKGTGVPTNIPYRLCPDVALNADPNTGDYVYLQKGEGGVGATGFWIIGGTSAASPTFAGGLADTEEQIIASGGLPANSAGKQRFGRIQNLLYSFNGSSTIFTDVTSGSNGTLNNGSASNAGTGWDFVTGWGVINFDNLAIAESNVPKLTSISVTPATVEGGSATSVTGTVTVASAAPAGGDVVTLTSSDPSASLPATVTVPAGATTATFTVTTKAVSASKSDTLTAAIGSSTITTTLTVTAPHVTAVSVSPTSVVGGTSATGTVTIAEAAPSGGLAVTLASGTPTAATVPATITVAFGATTATFPVTTIGVASSTSVQISATSGGVTQKATLAVTPAAFSSFTLSSTSAYGGQSLTGTITLTGQAPPSGASVKLALSNTAIASLSSSTAVIAAGATSGTFTVKAIALNTATTETVTATFGSAKTASFTVRPAILASVTPSASTVVGGVANSTITYTLNSPAGPAGLTLNIGATPATAATFGATTLVVPAGATTATATLTSLPVATNTGVTISGVSGVTLTALVTVDASVLTGISVTPSTVKGGSSTVVTGTVTLNGPAPAAGRVVTLTSSATSAATVPTSVTVPSGKTSATFTVTAKTVSVTTSVTLKATLGAVSQTATLNVTH